MQATHRFDHLARVNLINSIITITVIGATYVLYRWSSLIAAPHLVEAILFAYVLAKTYVGVSQVILAMRELNRVLERGWWKVSLQTLPGKRSLFAFAVNTNLNGTVNLFFRDNIPLYMANLLSTTAVGYFKIAMTFIIPITLILDPFIAPTYAEISCTIAEFDWKTTLRLLKRITVITGGVVLAIWTGWALTGWWIIPTLYKRQASPVYPLLLILIAGYSSTERGTIILASSRIRISPTGTTLDRRLAARRISRASARCCRTVVPTLDQRRPRISSSSRASEIPSGGASCRTSRDGVCQPIRVRKTPGAGPGDGDLARRPHRSPVGCPRHPV